MDLPSQSIPVGPRLTAVLEVAYRARRPVLLEGPTGIGKSEVVAQLADRLGVAHVVLDLSLLEPPDLVGLPVVEEGRTSYAAPEILPSGGEGILMLEELNRAERYIQQPALQLLTARRLHQYALPEGWSTMAAINPEDGEYQVTPLDPALRSRFMNLRVNAHRASWLSWAEANGIHPAVIELARRHDRIFDVTPPRTWTYVSDVLHALTPAEVQDRHLLRDALGGYLPDAWLDLLLRQRDDGALSTGPDARGLLRDYHRDEGLRETLAAMTREGRLDQLEQTAHHVRTLVGGAELGAMLGRGEFAMQAFDALLDDLPGDLREDVARAFGANPLAVGALDLDLTSLLTGYASSPAHRRMARWLREHPHRARAVITGLAAHIGRLPDLNVVRRNNGFRLSLGVLLEQVGVEAGEPLAVELYRLGVEPLFPGKH